jgi:hypothetical protein
MVSSSVPEAEMGGAAMSADFPFELADFVRKTFHHQMASHVRASDPPPEAEKGNSKPTQANRILRYLQAGHRLTALEALERFQCFRLAARIHELRQDNWQITERTVETASGKRIAEYSL